MSRRDIEIGVLSSVLRSKTPKKIVGALNGYTFTDPAFQWLVEQVRTAVTLGERPRVETLVASADTLPGDQSEILLEALAEIGKAKPTKSPLSDCEVLADYHEREKLTKAADRAVQALGHGDHDQARKIMGRAGQDSARNSLQPQSMLDFDEWDEPDRVKGISTGFNFLNEKLQGGFTRGDLVLLFGETGLGKSTLAVNFGVAAMAKRYRVLHIDSENTIEVVRCRYLSRLTQRPFLGLLRRYEQQDPRLKEWAVKNKERFDSLLKISDMEVAVTSLDQLKAMVEGMIGDDWRPDVIVIDQPDHIGVDSGQDNLAIATRRTWELMRGWAADLNAVIIAVTQAKDAKGRIAGISNVAWGADKIRNATIALSINEGMGEDPEAERRIFAAKVRTGPARFTVYVTADLHRCTLRQKQNAHDQVEGEEI